MLFSLYREAREEMKEGQRIVDALLKAERKKAKEKKKRSQRWAKKNPAGNAGQIREMDGTEMIARKGAFVNAR